jgi:hypothetical protein
VEKSLTTQAPCVIIKIQKRKGDKKMFVKFEGKIINVNAIEKAYFCVDHITIDFIGSSPLSIHVKKADAVQKMEELWALIQSVK